MTPGFKTVRSCGIPTRVAAAAYKNDPDYRAHVRGQNAPGEFNQEKAAIKYARWIIERDNIDWPTDAKLSCITKMMYPTDKHLTRKKYIIAIGWGNAARRIEIPNPFPLDEHGNQIAVEKI